MNDNLDFMVLMSISLLLIFFQLKTQKPDKHLTFFEGGKDTIGIVMSKHILGNVRVFYRRRS